jgi:uncharacterized protein YkwD
MGVLGLIAVSCSGYYVLMSQLGGMSYMQGVIGKADPTPAGSTAPSTDKEPATADPGRPINSGTGAEDPLAFVPADANIIMGFEGLSVMGHPLLQPMMDGWLVDLGLLKLLAGCRNETGLELRDLFSTVLIAQQLPPGADKAAATTVVLQSSVAFDQEKMKQWASPGDPLKLKGMFVYGKHKDMPQVRAFFMPSSRILVFSEVPAPQLIAGLSGDGIKPALPDDTVGMVRMVNKAQAWRVHAFSQADRSEIAAGKGPLLLFHSIMSKEVERTWKSVSSQSTGLVFRFNYDSTHFSMGLGLVCQNEAQSGDLHKGLQAAWNKHRPLQSKKIHNAMLFQPPERQRLVQEMLDSLQLERQGRLIEASVKVSQPPMAPLLKDRLPGLEKQALEITNHLSSELGLGALDVPLTLTADEQRLLDLVNAFRKQKMAAPLKVDRKLMEVARAHAANMAKQDKADDELDGKDTSTRVRESRYLFQKGKIEFNLAAGANLQLDDVYNQWATVPAKQELLLGGFDETGIGIARNNASGNVYCYQIYAVPER